MLDRLDPLVERARIVTGEHRHLDLADHRPVVDQLVDEKITLQQLAAIYTGKVRNWRDLGGNDAPIVLYGRENSSGTYDYFKQHMLGKADFTASVQTLQGTAAIVNSVGRDAVAPGMRSLTIMVPDSVPSDFHNSSPCAPSLATK